MESHACLIGTSLAEPQVEHKGSVQSVHHSRLLAFAGPDPDWPSVEVRLFIEFVTNLIVALFECIRGFYWLSGHHYILEKFQLTVITELNKDWPTNADNGSIEEEKNMVEE